MAGSGGTGKGTTLCLNMIVKDEALVIGSTLTNLCQHFNFDYWVIADTGSTDNTRGIIADFFKAKGIPGELCQHTWKDFGHNRTLALRAAYNKTDYLLIFDADDAIHGTLALPTLTADKYNLIFGPAFVYHRTLIINNRKRFKFVGVLHEYLQHEEPVGDAVTVTGDYHLESGRTGNRSQDPDKYLKDAQILADAFIEEADRNLANRYAFYCAQSYKDCKDTVGAIEWYTKVADTLPNWEQERYVACIELGKLYAQQSDLDNSLKYYLKAREVDKDRIEGHVYACSNLRAKDLHLFVVALFESVSEYTRDPVGKLFLHADQYKDALEYECSISAYYAKKPATGYLCCKRILVNNFLTESKLDATVNNLQFYVDECTNDADPLPLFYAINNRLSKDSETLRTVWKKLYTRCEGLLAGYSPYAPPTTPRDPASPSVLLTMTSCKRLDLFRKTVNSIVRHWQDKDMITQWVCVDDGSSEADRAAMRAEYPWFTFRMKSSSQRGHRQSMNMIWDMLREGSYTYWVHLEDDFLFHTTRSYVRDSVAALEALRPEGVRQVLFNRNYAEVVDIAPVIGHLPTSVPGIVLHDHKEGTFDYPNSHYWPHYSFRPSVVDVAAILQLGNYDSVNTFFEMDYARRWTAAGYQSAFFDAVCCRHIGRLTSERFNASVPNAYDLNGVGQFAQSAAPPTPSIKIVNLERRPDRRAAMISTLAAAGVSPDTYEFVTAVDGEKLQCTPGLVHLFKGNDFGSRRGFIGCAMSHVRLWQALVADTSATHYVVLEDDITLCEGFADKLSALVSNLPSDAGVIFFGYHMMASNRASQTPLAQPVVRPLRNHLYIGGTYGYVVTTSGAKSMLEYVSQHGIKHGIDYCMKIMPGLSRWELFPELVFSEWNEGGRIIDTDIQQSCTSLPLTDDVFDFIPGLDILGHDMGYRPKPLWEMLDSAANDPTCVGVNTLGFFKNGVAVLKPSKYFKSSDGLYVKRCALEALSKLPPKKRRARVKMLCDWCSSQDLCNGFKKFGTTEYAWRNLSMTWEDNDVDYYMIINKPLAGAVFDPARTVVLHMEPWCHDPRQAWGVKTWGEWARPDPSKFLCVRTHADNCNLGAWMVEWTLEEFTTRTIDKPVEKRGVISTVTSSKYFDPGHIKRIDFMKYVEAKSDPAVRMDIYSADNQLGFSGYAGTATCGVDKSKGLIPYQYYFMCENNAETNFITEKLWEPLVCEALCFYWGCPNVADYVDPRAYVVLDMDDFEGAFAVVKAAVQGDLWTERLPYIRREKERVLHYHSFFPTLDRVLTEKQKAPKVCFLHSCNLDGVGTQALDHLLAALSTSGCLSALDQVRIYNVGLPLPTGVYEALAPGKIQVFHASDNPLLFEIPTLQAVHAFAAATPLAKVLYLHTKGVSSPTSVNIKDWINYMLYETVERWSRCVDALDTYDCAGCNQAATPYPHFSGNFWWATGLHIRTLAVSALTDKMSAEWWILSKPAYALELNRSGINHFHEAFPRARYCTDNKTGET